jgi:DNA mismatch endonuclease (patch repair protein)
MVDTLTPKGRSERMSRIKGKNTAPELVLRRALHASGFRYRLNVSTLPGKPDLVFPRWSAIVFVHGCFWHCHKGCRIAHIPQSSTEYWLEKFRANKRRDARAARALRALGWRVIVVWECQLSTSRRVQVVVKRVSSFLMRERQFSQEKRSRQ